MIFIHLDTETLRKLSILILLLCISIAIKNENAQREKNLSIFRWFSDSDSSPEFSSPLLTRPIFWSTKNRNPEVGGETRQPLEYDFYRDSCPLAENIIRAVVRQQYEVRPDTAPALLRIAFHDCFVEGCDASILLDSDEGTMSEKEAPPNEFLRGFDVIDTIKSEIEEVCPGVVSCADIVVLAAREAVVLAGGPFYPLFTGRRDSAVSFWDVAAYELPSPQGDLEETLASFASRGFDERETVSLLGAHSIGTMHCKFFQERLHNFGGTNEADPSLNTEFLNVLRSKCNDSRSSIQSAQSPSSQGYPSLAAPSPSFDSLFEGPAVRLESEGVGEGFGTLYYRNLLQGKGILYSDQQLMAGEETGIWVRAYASDASLFRRDFAKVMMKLSNIQVLTGPLGQIRRNCAKAV